MDIETELQADNSRIVYVRPVKADEVPEDVKSDGPLFSVNTANGEQLAIVEGRGMAFALARENDFAPVGVH